MTRATEKLSRQLESFRSLTNATGLQLSLSAIKNLQHIAQGRSDIEKISAKISDRQIFGEVLGVDQTMAWRLENHFTHKGQDSVEKIEGMTPELLIKFRQFFQE